MIVCYAFAIELYLKSLIQQNLKSHDITVLYGKINSPTRKTIAEAYKTRTGRNQRQLEHDLQHMNNAFMDWRYVFEGAGQQIHTNLLAALCKSILETAKSVHVEQCQLPHAMARIDRLLANLVSPSMTVVNLGGGTFLDIVDGTGGMLNTPEA
jgi:hypothetical protein